MNYGFSPECWSDLESGAGYIAPARIMVVDYYLNRLSRVCGAWFASDRAWVPNC
jgi:hypothetical protein